MPAPVKPDSGERRVANSLRAELGQQPFGYGIAAAIAANVLAHQKDALVPPQRIADGLAHRFAIGKFDQGGLVLSQS